VAERRWNYMQSLSKQGTAIQELSPRVECSHHWIIESPDGPTSWGQCKHCGAEKEFLNARPEPLGPISLVLDHAIGDPTQDS